MRPLHRLSPLLLILVWQISAISCVSLDFVNFPEKPSDLNFNKTRKNVTAPKNLSELIEFVPLDIPVESENASILPDGMIHDVPKIISVKLKTHVIVENPHSNSQTGFLEKNEDEKIKKPNETSNALSDIEYLDMLQNETQYFLNQKAHSRKARMSSVGRHESVPNTSEKELKRGFTEKIPDEDSAENQIDNKYHRSMLATGRQYVFHPYIPYGKDIAPDEKISFHDILPIKVAKFIKSMVEEADWNGMFKSMVRTVVDHFVNKIIEKMFTEKKDHDDFRKRSFDVLLTPAFFLPTFETPVVRLKRAVSASNSPGPEEHILRFLQSKRKAQEIDEVKKKSADERKTWLDHFLDFVFPNAKSDESDEEFSERLKKRDTSNSQLFKTIVAFFLNTFEKSSELLTDAKDILRYRMLKEFLPHIYEKRFMKNPDTSSNSIDAMKMTHRKFSPNSNEPKDIADISDVLFRRKRSTSDSGQKDEDRLWQSHSRRHRPHNNRHRDACSLRRACNAGRLLSRLPSIQEITLQLRSNGNEPHWDALIWGMKKKRCSRIFCKRPRTSKGSKFLWHSDKERASKKVEIVTVAPEVSDETDNLAI